MMMATVDTVTEDVITEDNAAAVPGQIPSAFAELVIATYEAQQLEQMGQLHNRFVAFISESGVALPNVITVLQLLLQEATALAAQKYMAQ